MTFHWRDGWYFTRLADGAVEVRNHGDINGHSDDESLVGKVTLEISAAEWASIVSSVSATDGRYYEALAFHHPELAQRAAVAAAKPRDAR